MSLSSTHSAKNLEDTAPNAINWHHRKQERLLNKNL